MSCSNLELFQIGLLHPLRLQEAVVVVGQTYSKRTDFIDVIAIRMGAFYFVFRPFWFGNLKDCTTKCALMADGLGFDWAGVFGGVVGNL